MKDQKKKGAAPFQENAPSKVQRAKPSKEMTILSILRAGQSLNRFEAERLGDHCLNTTISSLGNKGYLFRGEWETVPNRFGGETRVKRYYYLGVA
ncbi:helix-turn-helix domain-containing protein [Noviherbaspirillum galbum]|uniref:helix-turn-helix domain-containing protein n=1 Tax=Noviherbaspirillum galbum TaxID=2709383 RepID=UPI001F2E4D3D|nr:helix-turn-helix domain-containing protein [Noviherbaspirillum galbum]